MMHRIGINISDDTSSATSVLDDNFDLNRCILKYIRLRESSQFRAEIKKKDYGKSTTTLQNRINKFVSKSYT